MKRILSGARDRISRATGATSFLGAVGASATWQKLLAAESLAVATAWFRWMEGDAGVAVALDSGVSNSGHLGLVVVLYSVAVQSIFFAALCAEEAVRRGAPPRLTYFGTLLAASVSVGLALPYIRGSIGMRALPYGPERWTNLLDVIDSGVTGGVAMWIYLNRRSCRLMMDGVRNAEQRRRQLERELVDSRIASAHARIDPGALFADLERVRNGLRDGSPHAEAELETLIQRLRAALRTAAAPETSRP